MAALVLSGCGDATTDPPPPRPTTVTVSPAVAQLNAIAAMVQLTAEVRDQYGQLMVGVSLTWTTSDPSIAAVARTSGAVTATANGQATITATAGEASGSAAVTVLQELTTVTVEPAADTVVEGDTLRLTAQAADANDYPVADLQFVWASSDTGVATVDTFGLVAGRAAGDTEVTATSSGVTGHASLAVEAPAPTTIVLDPDTVAFSALGDTVRLRADVRDQIGRPMMDVAVNWATDNTQIATVDSTGLAIARGNGITRIVASAGEVVGSASVNVMQFVTAVTITPHTDTIAPADTLRLQAEALDKNGHTVPDVIFTWSSTNSLAASVDGLGLVYGITEGVAEIIVTTGTVEANAQITVLSPDRAALLALYHATGGPNWQYSENWLSDLPIGDWSGVRTDQFGRVVRLTLSHYNLVGPIPAELGSLSDLQWLELIGNHLTGRIPPELGNLANLTHLRLIGNALTGPIPLELGKLTSLVSLDLSFNNLSGPIPPDLGNLANLESLRVVSNNGSNALSGQIPTELGKLANLKSLSLNGNSLSGPIPSDLGDLLRLQVLDLGSNNGSNRLSGSIPPELGKLAALERLRLHRNDLAGPIPPELGNLTNLKSLGLGYNNLSGAIPQELGNLANVTAMWLHGNEFTGPLPQTLLTVNAFVRFDDNVSLCAPGTKSFVTWMTGRGRGPYCNDSDVVALGHLYATADGPRWTNSAEWLTSHALGEWYGVTADSLGRVVALALADNGLEGHIPSDIGELTRITRLRIGGNALYGRLPLSFVRLTLQELRYADTELCLPADEAFQAWVSNVPIHGGTGVECEPLSDRDVLTALHNATGGADWVENDNWVTDRRLEEWYGVNTDADGRVTSLTLVSNNLSGPIPWELGRLEELKSLLLGYNNLLGSIPPSLGTLRRLEFLYLNNNNLSGQIPSELGNLASLQRLHLSVNSFSGPIPSALGDLTGLESLVIESNDLTGSIPREFSYLATLTNLRLAANSLSGAIPPELGDLGELTSLRLSRNNLSGKLPPQLGELQRLHSLDLRDNRFSGPIPAELGRLTDLRDLELGGNSLIGAIPPELGNLTNLRRMNLGGNDLTGPIPPELGNLASLDLLSLHGNLLEGPVPSAFSRLGSLRELVLFDNAELAGALPIALSALRGLVVLLAGNTGLCALSEPGFKTWLENVPTHRLVKCVASTAYLTQAVQSREFPVPLVANEDALLRVFVTAQFATDEGIPAIRVRFYRDGRETHVEDVPGKHIPIPTAVDEAALSKSANAVIPGGVLQPGLEMVVEVDPHGTLDLALGVANRIPQTGRIGVEVRAMPLLDLTLIPFLYVADPDSSVVDIVDAVAASPESHSLLSDLRTLLPVGALSVTAHEPVLSSTQSSLELLRQTEAIRIIERGTGHYVGTMAGRSSNIAGRAFVPGRSSFSIPDSSVVAHELGHNMNLLHAPCGDPASLDRSFPYPDGSLGAWGYNFDLGKLVSADYSDLMSYCDPTWISEYHFAKALRFRLEDESDNASLTSTRSLLLWGGVDTEGTVFLDPAFVVDARPALPDVPGDYELAGQAQDGSELFAISFAMPGVADDQESSSFVFALPVFAEWQGQLASITLAGPGGSVAIDRDTDRPMVILRDPLTGRVRGMLRTGAAELSDSTRAVLAPGFEVWRSRGIPGGAAWNPGR